MGTLYGLLMKINNYFVFETVFQPKLDEGAILVNNQVVDNVNILLNADDVVTVDGKEYIVKEVFK